MPRDGFAKGGEPQTVPWGGGGVLLCELTLPPWVRFTVGAAVSPPAHPPAHRGARPSSACRWLGHHPTLNPKGYQSSQRNLAPQLSLRLTS